MARRFPGSRTARAIAVLAGSLALIAGPTMTLAAPTYAVSPITEVSASCAGQNAEVEQASDVQLGNVYATWMGCKGIAFARSTDGGLHFGRPIALPGASGSNVNAWDPTVTVAPDGTVYAAFMVAKSSQWYPVVATSFDHGLTFPQVASLLPPDAKNWGDRPFIATGPDGTIYVTWDYGPSGRPSRTSARPRGAVPSRPAT